LSGVGPPRGRKVVIDLSDRIANLGYARRYVLNL
jgi:hypothetical protein